MCNQRTSWHLFTVVYQYPAFSFDSQFELIRENLEKTQISVHFNQLFEMLPNFQLLKNDSPRKSISMRWIFITRKQRQNWISRKSYIRLCKVSRACGTPFFVRRTWFFFTFYALGWRRRVSNPQKGYPGPGGWVYWQYMEEAIMYFQFVCQAHPAIAARFSLAGVRCMFIGKYY